MRKKKSDLPIVYSLLRKIKSDTPTGTHDKWDIVIDWNPDANAIMQAIVNGDVFMYVYQVMYKLDGLQHVIQIGEFLEIQNKNKHSQKVVAAIKKATIYLFNLNKMSCIKLLEQTDCIEIIKRKNLLSIKIYWMRLKGLSSAVN